MPDPQGRYFHYYNNSKVFCTHKKNDVKRNASTRFHSESREIEGQLQGVKEKYIFVFSNYGFAF